MNTSTAFEPTGILPSELLNRDFGPAVSLLAGLSTSEDKEPGQTNHAVIIGSFGLLLPNDQISELVEGQAVCRLPNTAAWFGGVTSVRGDMVPVFDIHALLGIDHSAVTRRLIVVNEHEQAVAFWVDGYPRLVNLDEQHLMSGSPAVPAAITEHALKYFQKDDQVWVEWNIDAFFKSLGSKL